MTNLPLCVVVYLTDYCYLNCKHCFLVQTDQINKHTLKKDVIYKMIDDFSNNGVFMVAYTGGDPLLHPDIWEILRETSNRKLMPLLGVSGMNIDDFICKKMKKYGVGCVQIGFNGYNELTNDLYRGKGHFLSAISSTLMLRKYNINVNYAFCIDKDNYIDIRKMLNFALEQGAYKVKIEIWSSYGLNNETKIKTLEKNEINFINKECKKFEKEHLLSDWIQCPSSKSSVKNIRQKAIVIMADGSIKHREDGKNIGNIYNQKLSDCLIEKTKDKFD